MTVSKGNKMASATKQEAKEANKSGKKSSKRVRSLLDLFIYEAKTKRKENRQKKEPLLFAF